MSHLQKSSVETLCHEIGAGFNEIDHEVDLIWDARYPPLRLEVSELRTKHQESPEAIGYSAEKLVYSPVQSPSPVLEYFTNKSQPTLLHKALRLHAMHELMASTITFCDTSANYIATRLPRPTPQDYNLHSVLRLLNRQVKAETHIILQENTREVLEDLGKELNKRSKSTWASSFCVVLILCICEQVQIAVSGFVMSSRNYWVG